MLGSEGPARFALITGREAMHMQALANENRKLTLPQFKNAYLEDANAFSSAG